MCTNCCTASSEHVLFFPPPFPLSFALLPLRATPWVARLPPLHPSTLLDVNASEQTIQKQEELQFAVGAAVADLACSGPLCIPAGKVLEDMRASALAARREMKEEAAAVEQGAAGALIDALDYVLYQVGHRPVVSVRGLPIPGFFTRREIFPPLGCFSALERRPTMAWGEVGRGLSSILFL